MVILTLFISRTIKSFYIKLKIHNSDSHSKIFFINYTNIRVLIKKSMDFDDKVPTILRLTAAAYEVFVLMYLRSRFVDGY